VECDDAASSGEELQQVLALVTNLDVPRFLSVQDQNVSAIKLLLRRELHAALTASTALVEKGNPLFQELREVMRPWAMGLFTCADEHTQWLCSSSGAR
jgi:hypothetical protein